MESLYNKQMKRLTYVLFIFLIYSCSETSDDIFEEIVPEPIETHTYHLRQYYEKSIVVDKSNAETTENGQVVFVGSSIYHFSHRNEVLDTLTIDLKSFTSIKYLILSGGITSDPSYVSTKYATINYLKIIGLDERPNLQIEGNFGYGRVQVNNSNISIERLNSISRTQHKLGVNMFDKIDLEEKKETSFTLPDEKVIYTWAWFIDKGIGYTGYQNGRGGIKWEIIDIEKGYRY